MLSQPQPQLQRLARAAASAALLLLVVCAIFLTGAPSTPSTPHQRFASLLGITPRTPSASKPESVTSAKLPAGVRGPARALQAVAAAEPTVELPPTTGQGQGSTPEDVFAKNHFVFDKPAAGTPPKFAYVIIHYEGTPRDDQYKLAIRVLVKSLKRTGTKHDIVVLASTNVRQSTVDELVADGCIVTRVKNIPNPYKGDPSRRTTYKSHFEFTFNKLHLWNMLQYKRVAYFDADNVALHNMDEMFLCGHFCAEFMNQVNFHTGVMVVKPDRRKFLHMVDALHTLPSYDGADQGFLTAYFKGMASAPLFDASTGQQSEEPMNRLPFGYNLCHIYYYEKMSFYLQRTPRFANLTGRYFEVPALSLAYPITQFAKPWCWLPYFFFNIHWEWQFIRSLVHEDTDWGFIFFSRVLGIALGCITMSWLIHFLDTAQDTSASTSRSLGLTHANGGATALASGVAQFRNWLSHWIRYVIIRLGKHGPNIIGITAGVIASCAIGGPWGMLGVTVIPEIAPPWVAYPIVLVLHPLVVYWSASIFAILVRVPLPSVLIVAPAFAWSCFGLWLLNQDIYDQFLVKIWVLVAYFVGIVVYDINIFRSMAFAVAFTHGIKADYVGVVKATQFEHKFDRL